MTYRTDGSFDVTGPRFKFNLPNQRCQCCDLEVGGTGRPGIKTTWGNMLDELEHVGKIAEAQGVAYIPFTSSLPSLVLPQWKSGTQDELIAFLKSLGIVTYDKTRPRSDRWQWDLNRLKKL